MIMADDPSLIRIIHRTIREAWDAGFDRIGGFGLGKAPQPN